MIVERAANRLAEAIHNKIPDQSSSIPVLRYGLIIIMNTCMTIIFALLLGGFLGKLGDTAIVMLTIAMLRMVSGGYHFKASLGCTLFTTAAVVTIPHIALSYPVYLVLAILSVLLFLVYAPSNMQKQSRIPKRYYPLLKIISIVLVTAGLLLQWDAVTLSIFVQALSIIHLRKEVFKLWEKKSLN